MAGDAACSSAITLEESFHLPSTGYVSLPTQVHSGPIMRVFFEELASLQQIRIEEYKEGFH